MKLDKKEIKNRYAETVSEVTNIAKDSSKKRATLSDIRSYLSPETFENPNWKGIGLFLMNLTFFSIVMVSLYYAKSWYLIVLLEVLAGLTISGLFIIGHDAAHGALFKSEKLNRFIGQLAFLPSLHAYSQWAYGHNRIHHGHTIKREADFVWSPVTIEEYKKMNLIQKLQHKLYWSFLGAGPYYMIEVWLKGMMIYNAPVKNSVKDRILISVFGLSTALFAFYIGAGSGLDLQAGFWSFTKLWLLPFISWNYYIGLTVYVHHINPAISWKKHADWTPFYGQVHGTINYHIPWFFNIVLLNIYIHLPHHVHMKIPCYNLRRALEEMKKGYKDVIVERNTLFLDYLTSTSYCKLIDSETGEWHSYKSAREYSTYKLSMACHVE